MNHIEAVTIPSVGGVVIVITAWVRFVKDVSAISARGSRAEGVDDMVVNWQLGNGLDVLLFTSIVSHVDYRSAWKGARMHR